MGYQMRILLCLLMLFLLPNMALAEPSACRAKVGEQEIIIEYDDERLISDSLTYREWFLGMPSAARDWAWGNDPLCDSRVTIDYLGRDLPTDEVSGYCLAQADDESWMLIPGERNFRGRCPKTYCELVNMATDEATAVTAAIAGLVAGTNTTTAAAGITVVSHSSRAWIMTGSAGYVAKTLGAVGTTIVGILTSPATLLATGVTVVAVGGAVYLCQE